MVPCTETAWKDILARVEDSGADGVELNFGCPHGMSERGMGAAVGQVPEYIEMVTAWCKHYSRLPVIVKLTPNVGSIHPPALAAKRGGADAVSLINTVNSIMGVDPATLQMSPSTGGMGSHGGYCGPAVKPIALHMVAEIGRHADTAGLPISGIGGIGNWRDALDYIALGATNVQVCTAAMVYGFKIVQDMKDGLSEYMDTMGFATTADFQGRALPTVTDWQFLNLNSISKAVIDQDKCIGCGRCHIACEDTSHQAITALRDGQRHFEVKEADCVGCNLCVTVCPVPDCITLRELAPGEVDARTGTAAVAEKADWTQHPNNPMRTTSPA
jgi:dihydropyrimidine dehydrogenase (NAD+) subunit PreA